MKKASATVAIPASFCASNFWVGSKLLRADDGVTDQPVDQADRGEQADHRHQHDDHAQQRKTPRAEIEADRIERHR